MGKLLGQAGVSLVMLVMYGVAGLGGLSALAMGDLVPLSQVAWFLAWFPIAYFMVAAIMAISARITARVESSRAGLVPAT